MRRLFLLLLVAVLVSVSAWAGTLTGTVQRPNGVPLSNGTLSFTLSQAGSVGGITVTTDTFNCYTDSVGAVDGLPNPQVLPVLSSNLSSGTLPGGTYYVAVTYFSGSAETLASSPQTLVLSGSGTLIVAAPTFQPPTASGYKVYIGTDPAALHLQGSVTGWTSFSQTTTLNTGSAAPPASNNSVCNFSFNDVIVPSYTTYSVNLTDAQGRQVAGYPQRFYLQGSSVDLSTLTPATNVYAKFPNAIVAQPTGNGTQSIAGPLNLGSYKLTAGSLQIGSASGFDYLACTPQSQFGNITGAGAQAFGTICPISGGTLHAGAIVRFTGYYFHFSGSGSVAYSVQFGSFNGSFLSCTLGLVKVTATWHIFSSTQVFQDIEASCSTTGTGTNPIWIYSGSSIGTVNLNNSITITPFVNQTVAGDQTTAQIQYYEILQ